MNCMVFPWIAYLEVLEVEEELASVNILMGRQGEGSTEYNLSSFNFILPTTFDQENPALVRSNIKSQSTSALTSATLLYDDEIGTGAIQAPTGKKLLCIMIFTGLSSAANDLEIRASDTVNTGDGTVLWASTDSFGTADVIHPTKVIIVPSDKFLTITNLDTGGAYRLENVITFELDN